MTPCHSFCRLQLIAEHCRNIFFMKYLILVATMSCILFGCSDAPRQTNSLPANNDTVAHNNIDSVKSNDCVRGAAKPIVNKSIFPNTSFELKHDSSGIETIRLDNNGVVIIKNEGCEYYSLTFILENNYDGHDTADIPYWYNWTIAFLDSIKRGIDDPLVIGGINAIKNKVNHEKAGNLKLTEEIDYGPAGTNEIREFVSFDSIIKINERRCAVVVEFVMGPL